MAPQIDLQMVQTNIVIFHLPAGQTPPMWVAALRAGGVLCSAIGPHTVRLVTHFDVSREDCESAAESLVRVLRA